MPGRRRDRQGDRNADPADGQILAPITPIQQQFIEALLSGKSVTLAARLAGISRRTGVYWLADGPVRVEYEKQRAAALAEFDQRVTRLHTLAFQAIEELLSSSTPPFIRIQAVKMLWDASLREMCDLRVPGKVNSLTLEAADRYFDDQQERSSLGVRLYDDRNRERLEDED